MSNIKNFKMKTITLTALMFIIVVNIAQSQIDRTGPYHKANFDIVFSAGLSSLIIEPEIRDDKTTIAPEFSFGLEWQKTRILMQIKYNADVNFMKWTYLQFDFKQPLIKNVYVYGGLEVSQIKKKHTDASYDQADNYRDVTINPMQLGINLELQYKFLNNRGGVAIQGSLYQSEDELKPSKKYRKDVTLALFFYL